MLRNYLKTALRNLIRYKANSLINWAGLTIGFAAFLLIFLVSRYEQSFDNFHQEKNNIYRIVRIGKDPVKPEYRPGVPFPVTQGLRSELPQLQRTAAIFGDANVQVNITAPDGTILKKFKEQKVLTAEPQFFQIFDFSLAEGNIKSALNEPNTVLLTKDVANKYFGSWTIAIGKVIRLYGADMKVTGVLNNPPSNTDFPLGVVVSYATIIKNLRPNDWSSIDDANYCFVQLSNHTEVSQLRAALATFVNKHIRPVNPGYDLALQPLSEIHFDERYGNFSGRTFSKDLVFAIDLIGLFLLIIACVNFINLTTAQAVNRSREVGVRKVLGSSRVQLIFQFLGETGMTVLAALIGAAGLVVLLLPKINALLEIQLLTADLFKIDFLVLMGGGLILVTLFSGVYPAVILSGFKPVTVLKSIAGPAKSGISFRRALVVFQFVIAQGLIIGTLVVVSQMDYFRQADMGFNRNAVITANIPGDSLSRTKISLLHNELSKIPGVEQISFSTFSPSAEGGWFTDLKTEESRDKKSPDLIVSIKPSDASFIDLYHFSLLAGRAYFPSDTTREFVVNETLTRKLNLSHPKDAIGKKVSIGGKFWPIVGVVKDFHMNSLRDPIVPVVLLANKNAYGLVNIKISMSRAKNVITSMETIWNRYYPGYVFEYYFLDQSIADFYKSENQLSVLYKIFSGIAVFISCLGLYGMIAFMAVQRRKEIGIRKVLGAPVKAIVLMLSKEFTVLILVAFAIAAPIAWYYTNHWLQQYTFRIPVSAWFFVVTVVSALCIAWLTVSYTAIKAALANPVRSLRSE